MKKKKEKKKEINLIRLFFILVLIPALAVGGVFAWCTVQRRQAETALAAKDFDTAIACFEKDFLKGKARIPEVQYAKGQDFMDRGYYKEAMDLFASLGKEEDLAEARKHYGYQLVTSGQNEAAMDVYADDTGHVYWQTAATRHCYELIDQGKTEEAKALMQQIADQAAVADLNVYADTHLLRQAAEQEDYDTVKSLLPTIKDRNILKDWAYNDFNYTYAAEAVRAGDYETAMEFFGYCAYEDNLHYVTVFEHLLAGELEPAMEVLSTMGFTMLDHDLEMTWTEIISQAMGWNYSETDLEYRLADEYLTRRLWARQPDFTADSLVFGEHSSWMSQNYVSKISEDADFFPVDNLNALYASCGSNPNGKVLVIRSQKEYPQGTIHYAVDLGIMEYLSYDLYPVNLSEVEYIILTSYDYETAGRYKQTFSMGDNSVIDYFTFLRMKGQVQLTNVVTKEALYNSQWIRGTGEAEAHFSDQDYQCSNMPETGTHIITAVEKVRQRNAEAA